MTQEPTAGAPWPPWHEELLAAATDRVIPQGSSQAGWAGGVGHHVRTQWNRDLAWAQPDLSKLVGLLASIGFLRLDAAARDSALADLSAHPDTTALIATLVRVCREGYYGGSDAARPGGWDHVGYSPWPFADIPKPTPSLPGISPSELRASYDVVVIGSGPGGGVAARVLSEAGATVLLLERAANLTDAQLSGDHLHGKRMAVYDPIAGPGAGNPRIVEEPDGSSWQSDAPDGSDAWGLNAMVLGGGTRVWQGMAWRFLPEDFRMATDYGVPEGSSLVDWPFDYDELVPGYEWGESELGVSGELGPLTRRMPGHRGYPMPALPSDPTRALLGSAATSLGWGSGPIPLAINSVPRSGRPACVECNQCMGHACPVDAKNGSHNTFVPAAIATGNCDLLLAAQAVAIVNNGTRATAVELVVSEGGADRSIRVTCDRVVVAAGAIETPRLLLASGLGNDHVGRHLQAHAVSLVAGLTSAPIPTFRGPGHSVASMDFVHDGGGTIGGGVLFDAFAPYPLQLANWADRFGVPRYGAAHKEWMTTATGSIVGAMAMGQEVPHPEAKVRLDPSLRDRRGMPAVRIRRAIHSGTVANREYLTNRCREWLEAAGVSHIVDMFPQPVRRSPASEHSAGTVRMGTDPAASAANSDGLVWGAHNVYVCDGSLLPTNGSVNPTLTLVANAYRVASLLAR